MKTCRNNGFNLIELMVAVAIVGILAAVAIPRYSSHVIRGARAAAQTELLNLASLQEKIYLNSNSYASSVTAGYTGSATGGLGNTSGTISNGKYAVSFTGTPGQTYLLKAVPLTGIQQTGDGCLTIQENGLRLWYQNNDTCSGTTTSW